MNLYQVDIEHKIENGKVAVEQHFVNAENIKSVCEAFSSEILGGGFEVIMIKKQGTKN